METSACWEKRDTGKFICRWFVAYELIGSREFSGVYAGYAGGGTFLLERFYAKHDGDLLSALWTDNKDLLTGGAVSFDSCSPFSIAAMERSLDELWVWNDQHFWEDTDDVVLRKHLAKRLQRDDYLYYLRNASEVFLIRQICERGGLIAGPTL